MITVSAQVDKTGMIRRVMSGIDHVGDKSDELVTKVPSNNTNPEQDNYRLTYLPLKVADSRDYIGSTVLVRTRGDISEKEYCLIGVSPDILELSQRTGSGAIDFRIQNSEIEDIRVLVKQPD